MVEKCDECGGEVYLENEEYICQSCGNILESSEELVSERDYSKIKTSMKGRYFNSGLRKDEKETGFRAKGYNKKKVKATTYINQLKSIVESNLPEDEIEDIFEEIQEKIRKAYEGGYYSTKNKKAVIWANFLISISNRLADIELSENVKDKVRIIKYSIVLENLERDYPNDYIKGNNMSNIILNEIAEEKSKALSDKNEYCFFFDLEKTDSSYKKSRKRDFYKLFLGDSKNINRDIIWSYNNGIREKCIPIAREYVMHEIKNRFNKGEEINSYKRTGLFCVICYLFCKREFGRIKSQKEWTRFFGISESLFDKLYKDVKFFIKSIEKA